MTEVKSDGSIGFDIITKLMIANEIRGLQESDKQWGQKASVQLQRDRFRTAALIEGSTNPLSVDYSQLPGAENIHREILEKIMEGLELMDDEACGILRRRGDGMGWHLDTSDSSIQKKNEKGYKKGDIPIIGETEGDTLGINNLYPEGSFVVARIEKGKITQLFNESEW